MKQFYDDFQAQNTLEILKNSSKLWYDERLTS